MRVLIRTTPWHEERFGWAKALNSSLLGDGADSSLIADDRSEEERAVEPTGFYSFIRALDNVPEPGAWIIEDDASLADNFVPMAAWERAKHRGFILQGYSTEKADLTKGERWRTSRSFGSNLCVYYPVSIAKAILWFAKTWEKPASRPHRESDILVRSFLDGAGESYWNVVPNLATPRAGFSVRQGRQFAQPPSLTFHER